jgi:hypothetical protein
MEPYLSQSTGAASDILSRISGGISPEDIRSRMNPYQQNVIDVERRKAVEQADIQRRQLQDQAARAGVFGGSRSGVMESLLNRDLNTQLGDIQSIGSRDAYNSAVNQFFNEQNLGLESAGALSSLARSAQQARYGDASALEAIGATQRGIDQSQLDFDYQEFLRQENDPFQKNQFLLSSIASVLPSTAGQTATNTATTSGGSIWGDILGIAGTAAGAYFGGPMGAQIGGSIGSSIGGGKSGGSKNSSGGLSMFGFSEGGLVASLDDYRNAIFENEHSGNPDYNSRSRSSSAFGAYQFMPDTWDEIARRNPTLGLKELSRYGEDLPGPNEQDRAFESYLSFLKDRAIDSEDETEFTPEFASLAWNYGARGAREIMSADKDDSVKSIIGARAYNANRLGDKGVETVGDLLRHFRIGNAPVPNERPRGNSADNKQMPSSVSELLSAISNKPNSKDKKSKNFANGGLVSNEGSGLEPWLSWGGPLAGHIGPFDFGGFSRDEQEEISRVARERNPRTSLDENRERIYESSIESIIGSILGKTPEDTSDKPGMPSSVKDMLSQLGVTPLAPMEDTSDKPGMPSSPEEMIASLVGSQAEIPQDSKGKPEVDPAVMEEAVTNAAEQSGFFDSIGESAKGFWDKLTDDEYNETLMKFGLNLMAQDNRKPLGDQLGAAGLATFEDLAARRSAEAKAGITERETRVKERT